MLSKFARTLTRQTPAMSTVARLSERANAVLDAAHAPISFATGRIASRAPDAVSGLPRPTVAHTPLCALNISSLVRAVPSTAVPAAATPVRAFSTDRDSSFREGDPGNIAFTMEGVSKRVEKRLLFSNITTSFFHGAKIGILGKNGAGKSSLLRIMAGVDKDFDGKAMPVGDKKLGYLAQEPVLDETKTVLENVLEGVAEQKALLDRYDAMGDLMSEEDADIDALIEEQAALQQKIDELDCWDLMRTVEIAMTALCCPPGDAEVPPLSGGEKRRVALARLLLSKPDILLLDEPTNHLDAGSVQWLERYLDQYRGLVVAITHDRYFLDNVAGFILEIENGRFFPFRGNYSRWLDNKARRAEIEANNAKNFDKQLARELEWLKKRTHGRQAKGKARTARVEELVSQKESYRRSRIESGTLVIPSGPHLGASVIQLNDFGVAYDDSKGAGGVYTPEEIAELGGPDKVKWTFRDVNINVSPGQVVGIVGPNGIGKTTILKAIQGLVKPSEGIVQVGASVVFGYNAQTRESLRPDAEVWEEIGQGVDQIAIDSTKTINTRHYVAQFNFSGSDQNKRIRHLSGGERNRVHLAKSLMRGANVIMLDEPTNDLDVDTLRSLEEAMNSFDGCAFVVSHDRYFLDRVCTDVLAFFEQPDTNGNVRMSAKLFPGNYSEFERMFSEEHGKSFVDATNKNKHTRSMAHV
jgi:ATPase subunit of ABC transporter with duplicated ATPase domains